MYQQIWFLLKKMVYTNTFGAVCSLKVSLGEWGGGWAWANASAQAKSSSSSAPSFNIWNKPCPLQSTVQDSLQRFRGGLVCKVHRLFASLNSSFNLWCEEVCTNEFGSVCSLNVSLGEWGDGWAWANASAPANSSSSSSAPSGSSLPAIADTLSPANASSLRGLPCTLHLHPYTCTLHPSHETRQPTPLAVTATPLPGNAASFSEVCPTP